MKPGKNMNKIHNFLHICFSVLFASILLVSCAEKSDDTVKVGILHSETGSMAVSEIAVKRAELLAIEELNENGGVLGHIIVPVEEDGESNPRVFANKALKLIETDNVATIFGCWTSDSRKAVRTVVEDHYNLLWYPLQYEGMEASPNIMYIGAAPNQQIVPAIDFCFEKFGKRMYLIGSDYIFPHTANRIIKAQLKFLNGNVAGEQYVAMHETEFHEIIQDIIRKKPDVVINTLNGDSNIHFFKQMHEAGVDPEKIPVMNFSVGESDIENIGVENIAGNYMAWNYFENIDTSKNSRLIAKYKKKYGAAERIGDPVEAGYLAVHLWAAACKKAGSFDTEAVRIAAKGMYYIAPEGNVMIEGSNQHLNKKVRIGIVNDDGRIKEIWATAETVRPDPFLSTYAWARGL